MNAALLTPCHAVGVAFSHSLLVPCSSLQVPKIVHQTWMTHTVTAQHARPFESWEQCLPDDWLHVLWSDAEADQFVLSQGPSAFVPTYQAYAHPIQKVDSFR